MGDPFPAITEAGATGETARLFSDIRDVVGVRVVNLVWRHLATMDGALAATWLAVRPLYIEGIVDAEALRFRTRMAVPTLASLAGDEPAGVDAVLASYDHSNTINLFALGALLEKLRGEPNGHEHPARGPRLQAPDVALPPLVSESEVTPDAWACVLRLNRMGDSPQPLILASMYRNLAHWPAFLARIEPALALVQNDGSLARCISENRISARARSQVIAKVLDMPALGTDSRGRIEHAVEAFLDHAIYKMVTICRAIRMARGNGHYAAHGRNSGAV